MRATICLENFSILPADHIRATLGEAGIKVVQEAELLLAVADDYVQRDLGTLNRRAAELRRPWLLCKPIGREMWAGPMFLPGTNACWACLRHRLVENRWRDHQTWRERRSTRPNGFRAAPTIEGLFWSRIALECGKMDPWHSELVNQIITVDAITGSTRGHRVFRRPDCEICKESGDDRRNWSSEMTFREIIAANTVRLPVSSRD